MIQGIGVDIIKIGRIEKIINKTGEKFLDRIFTPDEKKYCQSQKNIYQHFAVRFAAKEAALKALGVSWDIVNWKTIEIISDGGQVPHLVFHGKMKDQTEQREVTRVLVSLSHQDEYAVAFVVVEG